MTTSRVWPSANRNRGIMATFLAVGVAASVASSSCSSRHRNDKGASHGRSAPADATQASESSFRRRRVSAIRSCLLRGSATHQAYGRSLDSATSLQRNRGHHYTDAAMPGSPDDLHKGTRLRRRLWLLDDADRAVPQPDPSPEREVLPGDARPFQNDAL